MQQLDNTIYDFITSEETNYALPVPVIEDYEWNMKDHIKKTIFYKNSQFLEGNTESERDHKPYKNVIRPILNLQYRAEGFDVKDIELYVNEAKNQHKSFLIKKKHENWARSNNLDTFIDEVVESYVDFGAALVKNVNSIRPEVVPLQSIVFCDQTDILSGPIGFKHYFSPDQLKAMEEFGWGTEGATHSVDDVIKMSEQSKKTGKAEGKVASTPGKYIEIYEVHGSLPERYLDDEMDYSEEEKYVGQMQIVCFYTDESGNKQGMTLFRGKEDRDDVFKLIIRDKIYGRALGFGGAEELFEPQIWINYDQIRMKGMLDEAAKVIYKTTDATFKNRNKIEDLENGDILELEGGHDIAQIDTSPKNMMLFENSVAQWEQHAQVMGSANDVGLGGQPKSGTPWRLQELVTAESNSLHEYRKGKLATFIDEIYRDWIIPHLGNEILKEEEFLVDLDYEEMQYVVEKVKSYEAERKIKQKVLNGELADPEEIDLYRNIVEETFKKDNKKFHKIMKNEFKNLPIDVKTNIAGKQKYLSAMVDKLSNVWRTVIANPAVLQAPSMAKLFNQIISYAGLDPVDFSDLTKIPLQNTAAPPATPAEQPAQAQ